MIVDDFDIFRSVFRPAETDPPLVVHPDAVLPETIAGKGFEPIAARDRQLAQYL